ncbi:MAG TPA: GNAT family protein [Candidatus Limnocylindria bacterium]|jgi:RimJ/RimL family protein N-acetyltransferase|nr:GNAT family protein [Candidatus Limnocylindria bacterium]
MSGGHPWPLFDVRLRTGGLELRLPDDGELGRLCEIARAGIHEPHEMPFAYAWTDLASPYFERSFMQFHWSTRANWSVEQWSLDLGVWADGVLVGMQGLGAHGFASTRTVGTGSWLGREHQGRGIGKLMRTAVLALAFDHLGAEWAKSGAFVDNPASAAVSRALGYEEIGVELQAPRGEEREAVQYLLSADGWRSRERPPVEVSGLERCWDMFGA